MFVKDNFDRLVTSLFARVKGDLPLIEIPSSTKEFFRGKTICLTGAGGSIGQAICQQIIEHLQPERIVCIDKSEMNLFSLEKNLGPNNSVEICYFLEDLNSSDIFKNIFTTYKIDVFIHAAAYKHVSISENNPASVLLNNLRSTLICLDACVKNKVAYFTLLSTDKAVKPNTVMGKSKRLCEQMVAAMHERGMDRYRSFRCGNVLGSSGSVIPEFIRQVYTQNKIIITDPEVRRYFVRPEDIAAHILNATALEEKYDIAFPEMGEAIPIIDLAKALLSELGKTDSVDIEFSQLLSCEKINEELYDSRCEKKINQFGNLCILSSSEKKSLRFLEKVSRLLQQVATADLEQIHQLLGKLDKDQEDVIPVLPAQVTLSSIWSVMGAASSQHIGPLSQSVEEFEDHLRQLTGSPYVVLTASGSAALHIASLLSAERFSSKDLYSSTFSFAASVFPSIHAGYKLHLLDVDPSHWHIDLNILEQQLSKNSSRSRPLVIVPHIYGGCADIDSVVELCGKYDAVLIEDAAEAIGVRWNGQHVGTFGEYGILSFNANKLITSAGGGALLLKDQESFHKAKQLISQGKVAAPYYLHTQVGFNYAMSGILAAIGRNELSHLDLYLQQRQKAHQQMQQELQSDISEVSFMKYHHSCLPNYWASALTLPVDDIEALRQDLLSQNIETRRLWMPLHQQPALKPLVKPTSCPVSEDLFARGVILPSGKAISENDVRYIVKNVKESVYHQSMRTKNSA